MVPSELPILILFYDQGGAHLFATTIKPLWARLYKAEGVIKLTAPSVLSLGRTLGASQEMSDDSTHGLQRSVAGRCEGARQRLQSHHAERLTEGSGRPRLPSRLADQRLRLLHRHAFARAVEGGYKVEKLVLVPAWREGGALFDDTERAALAWAETVTRVAETGVPDAEYEAAAAVFDRKQLVDLTIAIGLVNAYNRMAISFRATPEAAKQ
jgi:hypothetical protein